MTPDNLAIIWGPTLLGGHDIQDAGKLTCSLSLTTSQTDRICVEPHSVIVETILLNSRLIFDDAT